MKKYNILFLLIIVMCSFSFVRATSTSSNLKLIGKVIYLDPGHGGEDIGTSYKDIYEKDINLSICKKLQEVLEEEGAIVYLTRYGDYDLSRNNSPTRKKSDLNNRAKIINKSNADIYLSIHLNSLQSTSWRGAQVFYDDINEKNIEIANMMQKQLKIDLKTTREVKEIDNILMNRKITIPGVLIEVGFLSNPYDRYNLRQNDYQYRLANSIKNALIDYLT